MCYERGQQFIDKDGFHVVINAVLENSVTVQYLDLEWTTVNVSTEYFSENFTPA